MRHTKTSLTALILSGFFLACGGGDAGSDAPPMAEPDTPAPAETPAETPPSGGDMSNVQLPEGVTAEMVSAGEALYPNQICAACHGPDLTGVATLGPDLTDDTWLNSDGTYDQIVETITNGVAMPQEAAAPMPPKGGAPTLTDEQVRQLAAYIYALAHDGM